MNKSYPGIPAGVLDEDLEKHMTEKKGPFDAAIAILGLTHYRTDIHPTVQKMIDDAIRVLKAAGKIDKDYCLMFFNRVLESAGFNNSIIPNPSSQIRALLKALPDPEEDTPVPR